MILFGAFLTYLLLKIIAGRIEDLAEQMYKDPFSKFRQENEGETKVEETAVVEKKLNETQNNNQNTETKVNPSTSSSLSLFCKFAELVELEDEFSKFRKVIEQLRGFMPQDFSKNPVSSSVEASTTNQQQTKQRISWQIHLLSRSDRFEISTLRFKEINTSQIQKLFQLPRSLSTRLQKNQKKQVMKTIITTMIVMRIVKIRATRRKNVRIKLQDHRRRRNL